MKIRIKLKSTIAIIAVLVTAVGLLYYYLPVNRLGVTSELIMLGDLNNDNKWSNEDRERLHHLITNPFVADDLTHIKLDINKNGSIDEEDIALLEHIYEFPNPYQAEEKFKDKRIPFPKPRELFRYVPNHEYIQRPLFLLNHDIIDKAQLYFLQEIPTIPKSSPYQDELLNEIYNEALRFSIAYEARESQLTKVETDYVRQKINRCNELFKQEEYYSLLLNLIGLVEDAETLSIKEQSTFIKKILYFRDNLKAVLVSEEFSSFESGKISHLDIFELIESNLKSDLDITLELNTLAPPRDFSNLKNYVDRAKWQIYKSKTKVNDFKQLVKYAQYDRRYLRAVSRTTPKLTDIQLQNHNLPMILLYRESLRITNNNKKSALGLLDEAVRIPLGWVKGIPKDLLPSSIALENFLLPGNKEDGLDKSRHWNVFGGVAIYKSPSESLILSLKRELTDLRENDFSPEAMREFIRDTIANINGIYYVISINPSLLADNK